MRPLPYLFATLLLFAACPGGGPSDDDDRPDDDDGADDDDAADDDDGADDDDAADDDDGADDDDAGPEQPRVGPLDIVTSATYSRLVIELDIVEGHGPVGDAKELLEAELADLMAGGFISKPGGIEIVVDDTLPAQPDQSHVWTFDAQRALSEANRDLPAEPDTAYIHMIYLDGHSEFDDPPGAVLGYAYGGSWIVMFRDNIDRACNSSSALGLLSPQLADEACATAEAGVLLHEMGHLFGLVDNGLPMVVDHKDPDHGAHDDNEDCLMYWLAENSDAVNSVGTRFLGGDRSVTPFDQQCLDDLAAANAR